MRNIVLVSVASLAWSAASASAADMRPAMPYKAPPVAWSVYDWTGFYVGIHAAGARGEWTSSDVLGVFGPPGTTTDNNASGLLAGGQIGYNYQVGNFLVGVEGSYAFADVRNSVAMPFPGIGLEVSNRLKGLAMVTGRLGWAFDRWMVYAKGGWAWARNDVSVSFPTAFEFRSDDNRSGWTAGLGAEMAVMRNWTVQLEYDYVDLGTRTVSLTSPAFPGLTPPFDVKEILHQAKIGLNYRFNVF